MLTCACLSLQDSGAAESDAGGGSGGGGGAGAGAGAEALRRALEWELSLDTRDLRSHAWYHGAIPRVRAEEVVAADGDFLVRDCTSQPGNFVLTCRHRGQPLHFVINKVVIQPDTVYERVQFQFEDDCYDTVPDLITFYVGSGRHISSASGARIATPKTRRFPLSFYAATFGTPTALPLGAPLQISASPLGSAHATLRYNPYNSYRSPAATAPCSDRDMPPRLPSKKQRSQSLTPNADDRSFSADGVVQPPQPTTATPAPFSTHSLPRGAGGCFTGRQGSAGGVVRVTSDPALSPCLERRQFAGATEEDTGMPEQPPPKPSRVPSLPPGPATFARAASYHASGSDSGNGSGDSAQSSAAGDSGTGDGATSDVASADPLHPTHAPAFPLPTTQQQQQQQQQQRGVVIKNPRYDPRGGRRASSGCGAEYDSAGEESLLQWSAPDPAPTTAFDVEGFSTLLLPSVDNKPLDASALQGLHLMLQETGPRVLANHLTRVDLELTTGGGMKAGGCGGWEADLGLGVSCGLELCSLPHGRQLRLDLIERSECLKLLVAVTILTQPSEAERADVLNRWILVAIDTKTALGNLYGFCGIMMGLCMPQVQRLTSTWHVLRQKFTDSAFNFEAKLRPTLKSMNECTNPQAPNTTIPHLLPFVLLQERTLDDVLGTSPSSALAQSVLGSWENSTADFGLGTLFAHMESARKFGEALPTFRRNAEIVLGDTKVDDLLLDAFRTEFHLKFLWGSRGAAVAPADRHAKFDQVLCVMSEKCELPSPVHIPASTAV